MGRKARVQRTPEEKWQIVLEGLKSGNIAETCRKYEIAPNLYYRWKDEVEQGAKAALRERSAAARPDEDRTRKIRQLERALGERAADRDTKKRAGRVSCGQAHSQARELVARGKEAKLVAETLSLSRSASTTANERTGAAPTAATMSGSWPPAARSRPTAIVVWPGGCSASRIWRSTASACCG